MAFTNLYDDTFPADTELANLIGANLRQVRLDVQQRMAAISGLDASKPAFGADAQPANWNGILFFATDTGKIYQFNNPAWTDVTLNIGSRAVFMVNGAAGVPAASTAYYGTAAANIGNPEITFQFTMPLAGTFKGMFVTTSNSQPGTGTLVLTLRKGGVSQAITLSIGAGAAAGSFSDVAHTASFNAGDLISIQAVNNASSGSANISSTSLIY